MLVNKRLRTILQYTLLLALGIFLAWWSIRDLSADDKSQIKFALKRARYWLIIPVIIILLLSHYIRALRWRLLIEAVGYRPRVANTFFAVMIGYLANQAFPRMGEVLKCTVLARYDKIPADKLIGTIILERLIDALTLLLVFAITLAIQPNLYQQINDAIFQSSAKAEKTGGISGMIILLIIGALFVFIVAGWMIVKKKNWNDLGGLFKNIISRVWQGITAVRHLKKRGSFLLMTIMLWSLYLAGGYIGFFALQETEHYGIREAFTVLSAGSIGMIVMPGGIGAYAYLLEKTMQLYGLQKGIALAFGWLLWLAQTGVILLGGLLSFVAIPWYNKRKPIEKT